jgi:hypothetical protein
MLALVGALYCVGFTNPVGVAAGAWRQKVALSIWPN